MILRRGTPLDVLHPHIYAEYFHIPPPYLPPYFSHYARKSTILLLKNKIYIMVCGYPYHAGVAAGSKCYLEVYRRQEMGGRRCTDGDEISAISLVMLSLLCIGREQYSSLRKI
jgi:hypothetical protein